MAPTDCDQVLELNEESVESLSPLDAAGVDWHRRNAATALVWDADGEGVTAFAFAFAPGSSYQSINYRWHADRFGDFLYLDRIAVSSKARRHGIASALYDAAEAEARTHGRMVCEVYSDPPNPASLAFHQRRGYLPVGWLQQNNGHQTVMLEKPL